jgi:hypothetical protein
VQDVDLVAGMRAADEVHGGALLTQRRRQRATAHEMAQTDAGGGVDADGDVHGDVNYPDTEGLASMKCFSMVQER